MNLFITRKVMLAKAPREFILEGQEALHASKVMRVRKGEEIHATDGEGTLYQGVVLETSKGFVRAEISNSVRHPTPSPHIVLAIGRIKKRDRMEFAVEKAVELGVTEFNIYRGQNSIKKGLRVDRLQAAAYSAMKQSLRTWAPVVRESSGLTALLEEYPSVRTIVADETKPFTGLDLQKWKTEEKLLFIVGPEGGFSQEESALLSQNRYESISLGTYRLRTETAAISIANLFID